MEMTNARTLLLLTFAHVFAVAPDTFAQEGAVEPTTEVILASEVKWKPLNPARGNKGPQAGTLWGDQTGEGASGFLVKFVDGFSSPPHIHNITYRGVVIGGGLYNGDPKVEPMWMRTGSYWTQPAGAAHITAARGSSVAYVEIDKGPYLVLPTEEAFDDGERPVNVDASNIVWLDATNTTWIKLPAARTDYAKAETAEGPSIAFLWGEPQGEKACGTLIKLPAAFTGKMRSNGSTFRAVVIDGRVSHGLQDEGGITHLEPGSYFGSRGTFAHHVSRDGETGCLIYVRSEGRFDVVQEQPKQ